MTGPEALLAAHELIETSRRNGVYVEWFAACQPCGVELPWRREERDRAYMLHLIEAARTVTAEQVEAVEDLVQDYAQGVAPFGPTVDAALAALGLTVEGGDRSESVRDQAVSLNAIAERAAELRSPVSAYLLASPVGGIGLAREQFEVVVNSVAMLAASGLLRDALPPAIERDDSLARLLTGEHLTDQERREVADLRERMEGDRG